VSRLTCIDKNVGFLEKKSPSSLIISHQERGIEKSHEERARDGTNPFQTAGDKNLTTMVGCAEVMGRPMTF